MLYEDIVDIQDHFSHKLKKIMLQNVVAGVASLHHVKTQSDHDKAHGKPELTYDSYATLLLSAASTYDANVGFTSKTKLQLYAAKQMHYYTYSTNSTKIQTAHMTLILTVSPRKIHKRFMRLASFHTNNHDQL